MRKKKLLLVKIYNFLCIFQNKIFLEYIWAFDSTKKHLGYKYFPLYQKWFPYIMTSAPLLQKAYTRQKHTNYINILTIWHKSVIYEHKHTYIYTREKNLINSIDLWSI